MNAEIVAIGTELLLGVTVDTNSAYLAQQLASVGVPVVRVTLVGDDLPAMVATIQEASARSELVICSGGLGPTGDDLTREAIAQALDRPLEFHQALLDDIAARFASFKRTMSPSNRQQAFVPAGAHIIHNPRGTAPSFVVERNGRLVAALPGVPGELKWLTEHALLPYLRQEHGINRVLVVREMRASGTTEAAAGEQIGEFFNQPNPVVGITAKGGQYTIRLAATAATTEEAEAIIKPVLETIRERLRPFILDDEKLEQRVGRLLAEQQVRLALHETLIGAPVYHLLLSTPGGRAALTTATLGGADLTDEAAVRAAATNGAASHGMWQLVVAAEPSREGGMTPVHFALQAADGLDYTTRSFDLGIDNGYDILAVSALELVRRQLERMA